MMGAERTLNKETAVFIRFYIMSEIKNVEEFAKIVRSYCGIENELH